MGEAKGPQEGIEGLRTCMTSTEQALGVKTEKAGSRKPVRGTEPEKAASSVKQGEKWLAVV